MPKRDAAESNQSNRSTPRCPACTYDLRGAALAHSYSRRGEGVCPECGKTFKWAGVLEWRPHPWLFEYHYGKGEGRIASAIRTAGATLFPARFWSTISIEDDEFQPGAAGCLTSLLLLFVISVLPLTYLFRIRLAPSGAWARVKPSSLMHWFDALTAYLSIMIRSGTLILMWVVFAFLLLSLFLFARPKTRHIQPSHIVRSWIYTTCSVILWTVLGYVINIAIQIVGVVHQTKHDLLQYSSIWLSFVLPALAASGALWFGLERSIRLYLRVQYSAVISTIAFLMSACIVLLVIAQFGPYPAGYLHFLKGFCFW